MSDKEEQELADIIPFIPAGKIRCFITGKLRKDTPEENVRQRWARSLVGEYGYDVSDMDVEFPVRMGRKRKRADIVIFKPGSQRRQDTVFIIVEAKKEETKPGMEEGIEQLKSYMSACSSCKYGLWVGSEKKAYGKSDGGEIEDSGDIPRFGDTRPQPPKFQDLIPATDLKATLRRCHNYIYANQGIQKAEAFHELQKLIFCKVLDEKEAIDDKLRFFVRIDERRSIAGQRRLRDERIAPLFNDVKNRYPYIFESGDRVKLDLKVLAYIVSELQRYSFLNTRTDVKGQAYEELVGANLRGDRGEFFTPRNVCDMAVRMVLSLYLNKKLRKYILNETSLHPVS